MTNIFTHPLFRAALIAISVAFSALIIWASATGDILAEGSAMLALAWGKVTMVDLYLGFFAYMIIVCLVETDWRARLFWTLPILVLGNLFSLIWLAVRAKKILRLVKGA